MCTKSPEQIKERIAELERDRFGLRCGDDFLFTNRNGNLPLYEAMGKEIKELQAQLNDQNISNMASS